MELIAGWQARSLAGNDKGKTYVIKEDCGEYAFLIREDGKVLRKNKKHIQVIKTKQSGRIDHESTAACNCETTYRR